MSVRNLFCLSLTFLLWSAQAFSQATYTLVNDATVYSGCNCYQLTPASNNQGGGVYQDSTINLTNSFDYTFNIYLGCNTGGADGMVFVLSNNITVIGATGGGLGYSGLPGNSVGIEYDTYQNGWDPPYNHMAIEVDGQVEHPTGTISGPVSTLPSQGYVDDCNWHTTRIVWDAVGQTYSAYFDGNLRVTYTGDIVTNYFAGNPIVNWGWSGGTGALNNAQRICTSRTSSWLAGSNYRSCNASVAFQDISTSPLGSVTNWAWNFGDPASGLGDTSSQENPIHTFSDTGTFTVTLIISDITGCPDTFSHTVVIKAPISVTPTIVEPICNGTANGSISVVPAGGFASSTGGYKYMWNTSSTDSDIAGLSSGNYYLTVSDSLCSSNFSYVLGQPNAVSVSVVNSVNDSCYSYCNGRVTVHATGGIPGYTFLWSNGTTGVTDSNLCANIYTVTVTDSNHCVATVKDTITQPASNLALVMDSVNDLCFGQATGQASVTASGGSPGYTYQWNTAGSTPMITGLATGTYSVTVKDQFGCGAIGRVNITQPSSAVSVQVSQTPIVCRGTNTGAATAQAAGGTPGYTYLWNSSSTTATTSGLAPGTYTVTVADTNGCTVVGSTVIAPGTDSVIINILARAAICGAANGDISITPSGGTAPYQYNWSNAATTSSIDSVAGGVSYQVTVTDGSGCTSTASIPLVQYPALTSTATYKDDTCDQKKGSASVTVNSGTPPFTYVWSPSGLDTTQLDSGLYILTITDAEGCVNIDSFPIGNDTTDCVTGVAFATAFTPNGDSKNDFFIPVYTPTLATFHMRIYDRWGQFIFETYDPTKGWDGTFKGKPQPEGDYIWFADYTFSNIKGTQNKTGNISLFR